MGLTTAHPAKGLSKEAGRFPGAGSPGGSEVHFDLSSALPSYESGAEVNASLSANEAVLSSPPETPPCCHSALSSLKTLGLSLRAC